METMETSEVVIGRDETVNVDHVQNFNQWMKKYARPYREMMSFYSCAIMEVETKFRVLNEQFSLEYDRNPIEGIKSRIKSVESLAKKVRDKNIPMTIQSIEENINDIAGIRVICAFPEDIYMLQPNEEILL